MTEFFNQRRETQKRRQLRNTMPPAERILWSRLRRRQIHGHRFRRQYSVGPYVIDFYCPALNLAIELDGESHLLQHAKDYDQSRQRYIEGFGIRFCRFTNTEVFEDLDAVVGAIAARVEELATPL